MIESNEIRQGNYLLDRFGEVEQITQFDTYNWLEDDYSGIVLNENWLVKFGMQLPINDHFDSEYQYEDPFYKFNKTSQSLIDASFVYDGLEFYVDSEGFWFPILNTQTKILYVHEFQNLIFALTKKELEIINQIK